MLLKIHSISVLFFVFAFCPVKAQDKVLEDGQARISKMLDTVIFEGLNRDVLKDSTAIYALNFKLDIVRQNNKTSVVQLTANDSLAYQLFPSYKKLSLLDYSSLAGKKRKYTLIIPVIIGTYASHQAKAENLKRGKDAISVEMALNSATALFYPGAFNNKKDGGSIALSYLGRKRTPIRSEDMVYLFPQTLAVDMNVYQ